VDFSDNYTQPQNHSGCPSGEQGTLANDLTDDKTLDETDDKRGGGDGRGDDSTNDKFGTDDKTKTDIEAGGGS